MRTSANLSAALTAFALSACTTLPGGIDYSKMDAAQIKALTADKSISAACTTVRSPLGSIVTVTLTVDRGTVVNGAVSVDQTCEIAVVSSRPPRGGQ